MDGESDDDFNCSYEEDNPSETSAVSINISDLDFLDETVDSNAEDNLLDDSLLNVSFDDSVASTPSKRMTRSQSAAETPKRSTRSQTAAEMQKTKGGKRQAKGNAKKKPTGTAKRNGKDNDDNNNGTVFKVPKAPPTYFAKCGKCGKGLKTMQSFQTHQEAHTWKELASKIPAEEDIRSQCNQRAATVLELMTNEQQVGEWGDKFNRVCADIMSKISTPQWNVFLKNVSDLIVGGVHGVDIKKRSLTFGAKSRHFMSTHINASLCDKETRDEILEKLLSVQVCEVQVAYPFLLNFLRTLGNSVLAGMFRLMSERDPLSQLGAKRSKDDFDHIKSKRVIHYIAGSCMRQMIRHAYSHPTSAKLQRRKMCILRRFGCIGEPIGAQRSDEAHWTSILNRKSLFFVKDEVLPFFVFFAKLVQNMELPDGSLNHDRVMQQIVGSPFMLQKWCDIISSELDDDESIDLLIKVVRALTNTFARGIVNRRMNVRSKKGKKNKTTMSVSHRARLL